MSFVGIDVGARRLHVVVLGDAGHVEDGCVLAATDWETVLAMCRGAECVAIDSPEKLSIAPHRGDTAVDGRTLSNKFRNARCAEIGLGIRHRIWVPWVTPQTDPSEWMKVGIDLFGHLHAASIQAIEVYPHAGFRVLAGGKQLPKKTEFPGMMECVDLLRRSGVDTAWLSLWSHDALDATLAAIVARDHYAGRAHLATCGHDGSAIWLPAPL